jgi:uncharacterized membrane protein
MAAPHHVENPFEYAVEKFAWALRDFARFMIPHPERHAGKAVPQVRKIEAEDLGEALRKGIADMGAFRDDVLFIGVIYPVAGLLMAGFAFNSNLLPMLFPLVSGFAIVGPVAATGLYEMSRRREQGEHVTWLDAFKAFASPAIGSIIGMGLILLSLFGVWLAVAYQIGVATLGADTPPTLGLFMREVSASPALIVGGVGVGFLFAALAFVLSVVSVPLLLDRDVGLRIALTTSFRAVRANPGLMILWAAIIAGTLVLGSIPLLVGLVLVVPMLGHASWHLYRKLIV